MNSGVLQLKDSLLCPLLPGAFETVEIEIQAYGFSVPRVLADIARDFTDFLDNPAAIGRMPTIVRSVTHHGGLMSRRQRL